ncbi:putative g-protein coupled receptor 21 [Gigaspora margarita]|uniref:Putative g-protein coupled receptor 21 n=1 Tax=Gigaspora margarita TaxID=4874 RepID=A0A8H4EPX5_GIGMA|nr:putative g-protein coupled receptor 21 [Gigaspora margarita]
MLSMTQPSKILIFILYDILKILTPAFADKSLDKFINSTNDTKLTYDTSKNDTPIQLDSPENIDDLKLVVIITYIMVFFNTIGCSYVFYRSWLQWKISTKSLSMIFRLPFYTAIADAGIDIVGIINIWTPVQIFCAAKFFDIDSAWIYVVCVIGINFGGLGNAIQYILNEGWHPRNVDPNVSWSFAESPSRFIKRFYPNSQNMHTPSSISSLPSSRPPSSSTISACVRNSQQINNKMNHNNKNHNSNNNNNNNNNSNINHNNNSILSSNNDNNNDDNNSYHHRSFYYNHHHSSSTISSPHFCAYKTFDKYGATNSICSDFLNNANNSSNNSVKELNSNPYNIEINIDVNNFVTESEMALSKVKIKEK